MPTSSDPQLISSFAAELFPMRLENLESKGTMLRCSNAMCQSLFTHFACTSFVIQQISVHASDSEMHMASAIVS